MNYQPPQYEARTTRKGQRLHGYITNHSGDWKPALLSEEYKKNFDNIKWRDNNVRSGSRIYTQAQGIGQTS